ncbi:MAG TPA: 16S rRNA (cytidine(1402)-2'-O)-methyltransferase [Candidatus Nanopelagicaceae bacterium]
MSKLIVAATPLGNFRDASERLREAIKESRFIVVEDSRKFSRLCSDLGIESKAKILTFFEGNEKERLIELERALIEFPEVLLLTDAGMPGISDPGYRAVSLAISKGIDVVVIPGPSAVTTALVLSGLPSDRFTFEGFLSRKEGGREKELAALAQEERTMVFFEAPHRIEEFLSDAVEIFGGERKAAVCREMTKTYEEVQRGTLLELSKWAASKEMLGEITVVIAGFVPSRIEYSDKELAEKVVEYEQAGIGRKEAISMVAKELALPKRLVFDAMVKNK